ncbi:hypothetical protein JNUCC64_11030 [Streptomyces sp. JNUCC 64]
MHTYDSLVHRCDEVDRVDHIMTVAFAEDPVFAWVAPPGTERRERWLGALMRSWQAFARRNGGFTVMNALHTAAMIHLPPRDGGLSRAAVEEFHEDIRATCGPIAEAAVTLLELLAAGEPEGLPPHLHCCLAGSLPEGQRSGAMSSLVTWTKGYADALGWEVYSEASTPRTLARWRRTGMIPVGEPITLPGGDLSLTPVITAFHTTYAHTATGTGPRPPTTP